MRKSEIKRKTNEVDIKGEFSIDGEGKYKIKTSVDFLDHLFTAFTFHGLFDLMLEAKGDLKHHLLEDLGIALGGAFKKALGDCAGIRRFGHSYVVMETALSRVVIDISGRAFYKRDTLYDRAMPSLDSSDVDGISLKDIDEFMKGFAEHAKVNIHLSYVYYAEQGETGDPHHVLESIFKAFGVALELASLVDHRRTGVPSTKGIID